MATVEFPDRQTDTLLVEGGQSTAGAAFHGKLQGLFAEATALANQLRKTAASVSGQADSPAGGWSLLQVLDRLGPLTVPAIARIRAVSRQSTQTLVNRLETHGYVALTVNPAHKKSGLVHLTDRGKRLLAAATAREFKSSEALLPHVAESRLVPAARLLRRLRELLSGNAFPPAEVARERPARRASRRGKAGPGPVDVSPPPEPSEPDEAEFPLSLL
jgi:DNA-binding MarR family transcriptional regulator